MCTDFFEKPEGNRPLRRRRGMWDDNVKMCVKETGLGGIDWIHLAQDQGKWWCVV
jgi:hypothetical protein